VRSHAESRGERLAFVLAGLSLVGLGIWIGVPLLNWIVGPAFVVTFVVLVGPFLDRVSGGQRR